MTEKNSFGPKCHGCVIFCSDGASALRVLAIYHLRLYVEDFEPQPEVGLDAEEGLAHDDKRRDVEEGIWGHV